MPLQARLVAFMYGSVVTVLLVGVSAALGAAFLENDDRIGEALRDGGPLLVLVLGMIVTTLLALRPPYRTRGDRRG